MMSRIHAIGSLSFAFSGLALGACATSGPDAPEPAVSEAVPLQSGLPPEILAAPAPATEVDVVQIDVTDAALAEQEIRITCDLERKPGTRIVIGQSCERVGDASGITFHPDDWDLKIKSPGVYEMRRRQ